jgi:hypothetical protein
MANRPTMAAVRELAGWKEPVVVATTANVDVATGGLLTIDGVVTVAGGRVLVKDQTDASENGIYLASAGEWYRAPDAMSSRNIDRGLMVWVQSGTTNTGTVWRFTTLSPDVGTDDINLVLMEFGSGIGEAPLDGNQYGRQDGDWTLIEADVEYATVAETRAAAAGLKVLTVNLIEDAAALVPLTDGATIAVDWDSGVNFSVTLEGNRVLGNPTNGQPGTWRTFIVTQDGTGSRTLSYGDQYKFEGGNEPVLTTAAGSVDVLSMLCISATNFFVWSSGDMKA